MAFKITGTIDDNNKEATPQFDFSQNDVSEEHVFGLTSEVEDNQYIPPEISSMGSSIADDLRNASLITNKINPVQAAKDVQLANYMDVPVDYFLTDDDIRKKVSESANERKIYEADWENTVLQFPVLSNFLSDPKNMATAKDSLNELAEQETYFKALNQKYPGSTIGPRFKYQDTTIGSKQASWFKIVENSLYNMAARANQSIYSLGRLPIEAAFGEDNSVVKWLNEQSATSQGVVEEAQRVGETTKGVKKFGYTGISGALEMAPAMALTAMSGGTSQAATLGAESSVLLNSLKSMLPFGVQAAGGYIEEAKQEGGSLTQQAAMGLYGGSVEMVTELPFVRDYLAMTGSEAIVKTGIKNIVKEFGKTGLDFVKNTAEDAIGEVIASPLTQAAKKSIYQSDMPLFGENGVISIPQAGADAYGAFAMSTVMHAMGLPFSSRAHQMAKAIIETGKTPSNSQLMKLNNLAQIESSHIEAKAKIDEAKSNAEAYKNTGELVAKSQYLERLPESWRTLAESHLKDGQLENIYIDTEPFVTLMQSMTPEGVNSVAVINQVAEELGIFSQLQEAIDTGKAIKIPYATWLEKVAKTSIYKQLEKDIKFSEDGLTLAQSEVEEKRVKTVLETEQKSAEQQIAWHDTLAQGYDTIYNNMKEKILQAGKPENIKEKEFNSWADNNARIYASHAVTEAVRRKINPVEWYMGQNAPTIQQMENIPGQAAQEGLKQSAVTQSLQEFRDKWTNQGVENYLSEKNDIIALSQVIVPKEQRSKGTGTNFMNELINYADSTGQKIVLSPSTDFDGTSVNRLKSFYKRFGFIENKGKNADYRISESMYREPEKIMQLVNENLGENQGSTFLQGEQETRGFIQLGEQNSLIGLLKSADSSTFVHEASHLFLNDSFNFVRSGQADAEYMDYWNKIVKHLDIKEEQETLTVEQHEQFAREFEAYLMEGKAPSEGLKKPFAAFRRWLVRIYRDISGLGVQVTDEVRNIMDRMLATEDEIRAQEMANGYLDDIVKESDVSPAVWNKLQDLKTKAHEMAIETLMNSQMKELSIDHQEMLKKEREKAKTDIEKTVAELPVYKTIEAIKLAFKFEKSISDLADRYLKGEEFPNGGNIRFDAIAESFDYSSGDEMAKAIRKTPEFKTEVEKRLDNYMAANYDDLKNTPAISEAAKNAVHNDVQLEVMALEKTILANLINIENKKQTTKKYNSDLAKVATASAKKYAGSILNSKPYREATATVSYFTAEKNAAVKEAKAIVEKNYRDASMYAEQKLLNHALAIESIKIKTRVQKMEDYLKKTQRKKMEAFKTEVHFVQIASILDRFGFSRSDYDPTTKQETLSAWIEKMDQLTNMVDIPDWIQDESIVKQYKELTIDELQDVVDAVKNIQHVANMENKTLVAWGKIDIREIASKLKEAADENIKTKPEVKLGSYRSRIEKIAESIDSAKFTILNVETILRELDGFESMGPWWKTFYEMFNNASNDETSRMIKAIDEYRKILSVYSEKERDKMANQRVYLPEINASLIKNDIISIALNWGNSANKERLLGGREWDEATIKSMLEKNLDKRDWEFVQNVWNFLNGFWPDASKLHEELTGFKPSKVDSESFEVTLPDGSIHQMKGGYYPLKRDYNVDIRAAREQDADNPLYKETPTWRAMTKKNHLKNRSVHAQYPVLLDINLIQRHATDVIHDIAFRKAVIDANRMLRADGEIAKIVQENIGMNGFKTLENWIKAAAGDRPQPTLKAWDRMFSWIRRHTVIFALGGRIGTMFQNMANFTSAVNAMEGFGWGNVAHAALSNGIMDYYGKSIFNPKHATEIDSFIMGKSPFMHERSTTFDRDIKEMTSRMFNNDNKLQRFSMAGYSYFDKLVNVPLWLEAYRLEINKSGNEELAIQYADSLVRKTSGSGRTIDMPEIMRSNETMKLFTMFYSFMNSQLNLSYEAMSQFKKEGDIPKFLGRTMALWILPSILGTLMAFKSPGDDDKTSWWLKQILTYPTQMIPVIRDMVNVVMDSALGMKSFGYKPTAASGIVEAFQGLAGSLRGLAEGEKELPEVIESGTKAAGYVTPYPNMFNAWFWNVWDYMSGMEPELRDVLKRRPRNER